ncbi:hypothetical protein [Celeribacter neptunius]|uniref:Lipoprotein n=1 Tax=Celeribacter neptunius TaxID=588602 RepID=A0A1I3UQ40_9RHOB|nr:hypothetical protein [Celeribacter neptunius]SFJ83877.1 hypothetical protein SAMN04487991_3115 [Celeribacter neptunius]
MTRVFMAFAMMIGLVACGADGDPVKPEVGVSTTVGVNSKGGSYTDTDINIHIPLN